MPTDKPGQLLVEEAPPTTSPIENEIPTYRAIDNRAVASVICGVLASFSFAHIGFLVFAVAAVVLGLLANVEIKRKLDMLTGRRLANTGVALGLVFGLTVVTYTGIQTFILTREATKFATFYGKVLKEGTFGDAMLYRQPPETRKGKTAEEVEAEFNAMKAKERGMMEIRMGPFNNLRKALGPKGSHLDFVRIQSQGVDDSHPGQIGYFAAALYEVGSPLAKDSSGGNQYAVVLLKGESKGRHYEWWVEEVQFPVAPNFKVAPKPIDDGHGHGPGGH